MDLPDVTNMSYKGFEISCFANPRRGTRYSYCAFVYREPGHELLFRVEAYTTHAHMAAQDRSEESRHWAERLLEVSMDVAKGRVDLGEYEVGQLYEQEVAYDDQEDELLPVLSGDTISHLQIGKLILRSLGDLRERSGESYRKASLNVSGLCTVLGIDQNQYYLSVENLLADNLIEARHEREKSIKHGELFISANGVKALAGGLGESRLSPTVGAFVSETRLQELRDLKPVKFDFRKLIRLCEELNESYYAGSYFCVGMTVRAIMDHIPPIFGFTSFLSFANQYGGSKSFKDLMKRLEETFRKLGDAYLHTQIRNSETLPNENQVEFRSEMDMLLAEIVRVSTQV